MDNYQIHSIFKSIQGEGIDTGLPAVFIRMAGCNQNCEFCDTDFSSKIEMNYIELFEAVEDVVNGTNITLVTFTGGEPLLQNLYPVVDMLRKVGYRIGLETNGTINADLNCFDSISLSPKIPRHKIFLKRCHSLKVLYPYLPDIEPYYFRHYPAIWRGIQPIDTGDDFRNNQILKQAIKEVQSLGNQWRLGLQVHKLIGVE